MSSKKLIQRPVTDSYVGSQKIGFYDQLLSSLEESQNDKGVFASIGDWASKTEIILDGKPFSFQRHEYLVEPYADNSPYIVELKAAQMGLTTKALLRAFFGCRYLGYKGVLYMMPSRDHALDVSKGRVSPLIIENPDTLGKWIRETDAASIKQVAGAFIYFRGMRSRAGLKSVPVDLLIADELDEAPQSMMDMAHERLSHSEFKHFLALSNPTLPDYGISKMFEETNQQYWLLKCPSCNHFNCLEDSFPNCLVQVGSQVIRACEKCGGELDPAQGEWVAKHPSVTERRGYHFSQLFSAFVSPEEILNTYRTTSNLTDFWNLKIGIPWVEAVNRLSIEEVLALCGSEGIANSDSGPCYMGVDVGKSLHTVVGKKHSTKAGQIIHLGTYRDFTELDGLMKRFNVARAIIDALPETRQARAFAERHRGKVFLCWYSEGQTGQPIFNERDLTVKVNRSESLDASHLEILNGDIILPRESEIVREFSRHLHNIAKRLIEDEDTGSKKYQYVKLGEEHYRHAQNYESLARRSSPELVFPQFA